MPKKILFLCLALILVLFAVLTSCATSTPAAETKPFILKVAPSTVPPPPALGQTLVLDNQLKNIETLTKGRIKPEIYWSQTLVKATDMTTGIQSGLADMALIRPYGEPGKLPLSSIGEMPGISTDLWSLLWAYWDLVNQEPIKTSEMAKYKMHPIWTVFTQEVILISKTPIRSLADVKGKKIAAGIVQNS
jgi:TRAP-type C4-dicarboxylate transport system substrate-binding protein